MSEKQAQRVTRLHRAGHIPLPMHKIDDGGRSRDARDVSGAQLEGRSVEASPWSGALLPF